MPESQIRVEYNYHCGTDLSVVNAARRSFNKRSAWDVGENGDTKLKASDKSLLEFLARGMTSKDYEQFVNKVEDSIFGTYSISQGDKGLLKQLMWQWRNTPTHDTPFNHCFISFDVEAPIFVRAQLVKHEYLILSEFSRRYVTEGIEFYTPDTWRGTSEDKKQGSDPSVSIDTSYYYDPVEGTLTYNKDAYDTALECYEAMLTRGVAPEQARMVLPQATMTAWTWSGTLGAFAKMCQLRLSPDAQYEARLVAQQIYDQLKQYYPVSAKALVEGV